MEELEVSKRFNNGRVTYSWVCPACGELVNFKHWSDQMRCPWCNRLFAVVLKKF